jgi:hypothetical protein
MDYRSSSGFLYRKKLSGRTIMSEKIVKPGIVVPTPEQAAWADAEIGVLFHYDMQVFNPEYEVF